MKYISLISLFILASCSSNIPKLDTEKYVNRLAKVQMKCKRRQIQFISLMDDKAGDLNKCKFVSQVQKHKSSNQDVCPDLFQHLVKDGTNKVVVAPLESPFVMELRRIEMVDVYQCPTPLYKAFLQTEEKLRKL